MRLTVLPRPVPPRSTIPCAGAEAMESRAKQAPGSARRFAFRFQTQSLWWIAGRLAEIVQSGGLRWPGPSTAWMPWPSLQGRTCGVSCQRKPPLYPISIKTPQTANAFHSGASWSIRIRLANSENASMPARPFARLTQCGSQRGGFNTPPRTVARTRSHRSSSSCRRTTSGRPAGGPRPACGGRRCAPTPGRAGTPCPW